MVDGHEYFDSSALSSIVIFQKGETLFVNKQYISLTLANVYIGSERDELHVYIQVYALMKIDS